MPRSARKISPTGIYHVMLRGIDRQILFHDDRDFRSFISILQKCRELSQFNLYAYCLMNNHVHLLLRADGEELGQVIKRIAIRYAAMYNKRYDRIGHLFQDRYKSEAVDSDAYFLTVLRYIMMNPVKAGLCRNIEDYAYSSAGEYSGKRKLCDTAFAFGIIDRTTLVDYLRTPNEDIGLDETAYHMTDHEASDLICRLAHVENPGDCGKLPKEDLKECLPLIRKRGVSIRQLSRLTGLSVGILRNY